MARSKSIILSKDEKKAVIADLKMQIVAGKAITKTISANIKAAAKAHDALAKLAGKELAVSVKQLASHTAQLSAMTAKTL